MSRAALDVMYSTWCNMQ